MTPSINQTGSEAETTPEAEPKPVVFIVELCDSDGITVVHVSSTRPRAHQWIRDQWNFRTTRPDLNVDWGDEQRYWWAVYPETVDADSEKTAEVLTCEPDREHPLDILDCYGSVVKEQPPETYRKEDREACAEFWFGKPADQRGLTCQRKPAGTD